MPQRIKLQIASGTNKDTTVNNTPQYVDAQNARFWQNDLLKDAGFSMVSYLGGDTVLGCPRWLFNYRNPSNNNAFTLIGTDQRLYALLGNTLTNITPLETSTTAIADSLDTDFSTLGTDPISVTTGSKVLTVNSVAHGYSLNDRITLAGATATGGIGAGEINANHVVASIIDVDNYTTGEVVTAATSTVSGGGSSVTQASSIMNVNQTAHNYAEGDRVKLLAAIDFGGLQASEINAEHIIRDVSANAYKVVLNTIATSSVTSGGGSDTTVQGQISAGQCDASFGIGAGTGLAGTGLAGIGKQGGLVLNPRIYTGDNFGDNVILSPCDGSAVYEWTGTTTTAPAIPDNAPTDIDYLYVGDNMIVTFEGNKRRWSDIGESNDWTPAVDSSSNELIIRGAKPFISHVSLNGQFLEFTESQTYVSRFVPSSTYVWRTDSLSQRVGLIARNAVVTLNNVAYWWGQDDFHMSSGGQIISIPNNTIREFVFANLNKAQRQKIFAEARAEYQEVRFWYPSLDGGGEIDRMIIYNTVEGHFTEEAATYPRTAAAQESAIFNFPRLSSVDGYLFNHENGSTADGSPMDWYGLTNYAEIGEGTQLMRILGFVPDSTASEDVTVQYSTKLDLQDSVPVSESVSVITTSTQKVDFRATGRLRQVKVGGVNSSPVRVGALHEILQGAGRR